MAGTLQGTGETREEGLSVASACPNPVPWLSPQPGPDHVRNCPPRMDVTPSPPVPTLGAEPWQGIPSCRTELAFQPVAQNPESCPSLFSVQIGTLGKTPGCPVEGRGVFSCWGEAGCLDIFYSMTIKAEVWQGKVYSVSPKGALISKG